MCLQDVQIGKATRLTTRNFVIGTTAQKIFSHNPLRWGIVWSGTSTGTVWVSPDPGIVAFRGVPLTTASQAPFWNVTLHGDIVTEELWAIGSAANILLTAFETEFAGL